MLTLFFYVWWGNMEDMVKTVCRWVKREASVCVSYFFPMLQFEVWQRLLVVRLFLVQLYRHFIQHGLPLLCCLQVHRHNTIHGKCFCVCVCVLMCVCVCVPTFFASSKSISSLSFSFPSSVNCSSNFLLAKLDSWRQEEVGRDNQKSESMRRWFEFFLVKRWVEQWVLPVAERPGRLSEPTEPRIPPVSATTRPSAPPAARGADSSLGSSPSGSAHICIHHHRVILGKVKPVIWQRG